MKKMSVVCALVIAAAVLVGMSVQAGDHAFVGASKCKMCHKVQFASWEQTSHAKATDVAKASTDLAYAAAECSKCHATNNDEALAGVQCEACHGPGADYKKMSVMKDQEKAVANGLVLPTQEMCGECHKDDGHSKIVDLAAEINNTAAIHEFKNPPAK
ncbi:MAG: cytochrome c3 family protein [Thermoanaerobaculales bacterium]|nr:cytochrome c3 family protein [Thermoanaerobaculales bacterium]